MPEHIVAIDPRDPLVFRDARPFSVDPGAFAHTLSFPMPHTIAGAVRSHMIRNQPGFAGWSAAESARAERIECRGPLLVRDDGSVVYPAPRNAHIRRQDGPAPSFVATMALPDPSSRNQVLGPHSRADTDLDLAAVSPVMPLDTSENATTHPGKPYERIRWWSSSDTINWLLNRVDPRTGLSLREPMDELERTSRMHVSITPATQANKDGALFGVEALVFPLGTSMLCKIDTNNPELAMVPERFGPLGGERRVAGFRMSPIAWPDPPRDLGDAPKETQRVRLQLVTPAVFAGGWLPSHVAGALNAILGTSSTTWALRGVASGRPLAVSGWDYARSRPKPLRYAVPAGSVYFLEASRPVPTRDLMDTLWLQSFGDDEGRNGYGLALPGIW